MRYKVITTFKPGDWDKYAKRMVQSVLDKWPEVLITIYYQDTQPTLDDERISWVDIDKANPDLHKFREKYKSDPVAMGKLNEIPGGVRRSPRLKTEGGKDAFKESYLWNAVKFSYKVSCVTHAVKTYKNYDYVIWIDDDTYTFRNIPMQFIESICPNDTLVTYLGRENNKGSNKYPECGLVCYNIKHPLVQNFINDWEKLYISDEIFLCGSSIELTPVISIDKMKTSYSSQGPVTKKLKKLYFSVVSGELDKYRGWLTSIY